MIQLNAKEECCGCTACLSVCPKKCISMKSDEEGFLYPHINNNECINCGACEKVCPITKKNGIERKSSILIGAQSKDNNQRIKCTAGGLVSTIAEEMFKQGYNVFGCLYRNMMPCHSRAHSNDDINRFRGSKYVQSDMGMVFLEIVDLIKNGEKVLFIGTPCQVHGLKNIVGEKENLFTIDLLCLGVSSPGLFGKWVSFIENKYRCKVKDIQFRNKKYGYSTPNVQIILSNGKIIEQMYDSKAYVRTFFNYYNIRPCCYSCDFREAPRVSDLTVGDFSEICSYSREFDDDIGTTQAWIHTSKAIRIIKNVTHKIRTIEIEKDVSNVLGGSRNQIVRPADRELFFIDSEKKDYESFIQKWCPYKVKDLIASIAIRLIAVMPMKRRIRSIIRKKRNKKFYMAVRKANGSMKEGE